MTERIKTLLQILKSDSYKENRKAHTIVLTPEEEALPPFLQDAALLKKMLELEDPFFLPGDRIGFHRVNTSYLMCTAPSGKRIPSWSAGNIVPDYETVLHEGFEAIRTRILSYETTPFRQAAVVCLDTVLEFADRYAQKAKESGDPELYASLCRVPRKGATTLLEACVLMKFIIFTLRCNRNDHLTLGRFDKYMRPFYEADLKAGKTREELLEVIQEFFLSLNFDTDLYHGVQKGDNGQSLVLGGNGSFDDFSRLCMEAALELNVIDPKINLRVDKNTPDSLYEFGTLMTKQGMGFPQYSNDDVVIPGLIKLGYAPEDAADYAVAACWEFIIPGKGMDVPNLRTMNFPKVVNQTLYDHLETCDSFDLLLQHLDRAIEAECQDLMEKCNEMVLVKTDKRFHYSPYLSVFMVGCIESGKDISEYGAIYNNLGVHGAGIASAADALAAVREVIFEKKEYTPRQLLDALNADFEGCGELRNRLLSCPKMGNGNSCVDTLGYRLMDAFSKYFNGKPTVIGTTFRAGTGSAQGYWFHAKDLGATADGRHANQPFGCSFSPSLEARLSGPLSCIRSFTGHDLTNIMNGGPLTLELHDTVFRNEEGIKKVAQLVKAFVLLGGHQLQLNSVNREILLDAMEHPENHKNLIVRVWGWSGYFIELDKPFREHIIKRTEFTV